MASGPYSFIDIAVLEEVRNRFAQGDALVLLTVDLDEVIWANGPGAALLGFADIETVMGASPGLGFAARRQIAAAPGFPRMGRDRPVAIRLASGTTSRAVNFMVNSVTLPDGEPAVLLAVTAQVPGSYTRQEIARRVIEGFGEAGYFAALVEADGTAGAVSPGFDRLGIAIETIRELVADVTEEADRLVKRLIPASGRLLPAGIARLTDEPAVHLLVAVDEPVEEQAPTATETHVAEPTAASTAPDDGDPDLPAAPSDAELFERVEEDATAELAQTLPEAAPTPSSDEPRTEEAGHSDDWYFGAREDERRSASNMPTSTSTPDVGKGFRTADAPAASPVASNAVPLRKPGTEPVRFVWRTDAQGSFSSLSPEFVEAVGRQASDIVGMPFRDVATHFGFDPEGEIAGLLERRDTWSGRTVMWPVAGTSFVVPVDLAALPVYDRDRRFEGFRGFGVARMGEASVDVAARGLALDTNVPAIHEEIEEPVEAAADTIADPDSDAFRGEVPVISIAERRDRRDSDKVIRLAAHRQSQQPERQLSPGERNAFEEIRDRLRKDYQQDNGSNDTVATGAEKQTDDATTATVAPDADSAVAFDAEDSIDTVDVTGDTLPEEVADDAFDEPYLRALDGGQTEEEDGSIPVASRAADEAADDRPATVFDGEPRQFDDPGDSGNGAPAEDLLLSEAPPAPRPAPPLALSGFVPSAFSGVDGRAGIEAELIAGLPVPMLVHAGDDLYFANPEFLNLTGYASLDQLRREGGLDRLIVARGPDEATGPEGRKLMLRTLGGTTFPVDAHLQSIRWRAGSALLLTLRRVERDAPRSLPIASPHPGVEEMERLVAEMRTIIDTATDGVVLIDADGRIRNISRPAEALFGFDSGQVEGKPFASLFAIESQKAARDYLNGLAENGVASVLNDGREVIGREAEGRFIPLFMTIGRLPGSGGYCAVVRDITQWKRAEEELTQSRSRAERASSQKTEFLARVSHEIRTPLNAIIGFSELMIDEKFGPIGSERYRDYLRDINRSGNHVLDLVNDLLDISKIEAGEQEMNYEAVSLNDTLSESVALMQPQANRDRVIIRSSFASRLPEVVADLRSVRQIALNLLSNAIRYTQAGGQVIVSTSYETSGDVVMRVRDTGVGMTLAEIDQALKPFKQINALKRGRHDGTGLGLPLTKAMVEANRARFQISSTPGDGTMVEITFPSTRVLAN